MTDGLALLNQKREQRRRRIPPPLHPAPPPLDPPGIPAGDAVEAHTRIRENQEGLASTPIKPSSSGLGELYRSTIYFGSQEDDFLEEVRASARHLKPKVDATRSAVVRLAVKRLMADLTPAEVVNELRRQIPPGSTSPGRKRL